MMVRTRNVTRSRTMSLIFHPPLILFGSAPFTPPIAKCHFKVGAISNFRIAVYHSGNARWPSPAEGQIE